jgi:hypothetical protein
MWNHVIIFFTDYKSQIPLHTKGVKLEAMTVARIDKGL